MYDEFLAIAKEADALVAGAGADFQKFQACQPHFERIVRDRLYVAALHRLLRDNLTGDREVSPEISAGQYMVLLAGVGSTWAIIRHPPRPQKLYLVPNHSMSARIAPDAVAVHRYQAPEGLDLDLVDPDVVLRRVETFAPDMGQVFSRDGRFETLDVEPLGSSPALTFRVNSTPFGEFEWYVDRASMRPVQSFSLRQRESSLVTTFDLLGAVKSPESLAYLEEYVRHPMHFVRWKAIQTVARIDRKRGVELISAATVDPHPHVRLAAVSSLNALSAGAERRAGE